MKLVLKYQVSINYLFFPTKIEASTGEKYHNKSFEKQGYIIWIFNSSSNICSR